jgi:hypothetical protein
LQGLAHRFVGDGLDHIELNELIGAHLQGPRGLTSWRWAAPPGKQVGCLGASAEALARGGLWFFACQRRQALCDKALADVAYRMAMAAEGLGHVCIGPVGAVGIDVQHDMLKSDGS